MENILPNFKINFVNFKNFNVFRKKNILLPGRQIFQCWEYPRLGLELPFLAFFNLFI